MTPSKCCLRFSFILGLLLSIVGILIFVFENTLINKMVTKVILIRLIVKIHCYFSKTLKSVQLIPDNDIYKFWLKPPVPVYMTFYLFTLKNPQEFVKGGVKPAFQE